MAKVSIHRGLTIPNPDNKYHMFKADITIDDIDTTKDVDKQLKEAIEAYEKASELIEEPLAQSLANVANLGIEGLGIATDFTEHLKSDTAWKENVVKEVKKLQKAVEDVSSG